MNAEAPMQDLPKIDLWIDNACVQARTGRFAEACNPALGVPVRRVPLCGSEDVDAAVASAEEAYPAWRDTPPLRRARVLMRFCELHEARREEIVALISEEHGKTLEDALGSLTRGIEVVEFAAGIPHLLKGEFAENVGSGVDCVSLRQPLGVCAGITPFNFPAMVPPWMFPVAIACGICIVLKPSEKVPAASLRMAELLHEAGLPPGVPNVVHGGAEAVDALLAHPGVAAVSFVDSTSVVRHVYETGTRRRARHGDLGGGRRRRGGRWWTARACAARVRRRAAISARRCSTG